MKPLLVCSILLLASSAMGEQFQAQPGFPTQGYIVPRFARTDAPLKIRESKPCREYLSICERSCKERGEMFKFACIGQRFQPTENKRFNCQCNDDLGLSKK